MGHYINGRHTKVCVKNLHKDQILKQIEDLSNTTGQKERKILGGRNVESCNESVRGVWDVFHPSSSTRQNILQDRVEGVGAGLLGHKKKQT